MSALDYRVVSRLKIEQQEGKSIHSVYFTHGGKKMKVGKLLNKNIQHKTPYNLSSRELTELIYKLPSFEELVEIMGGRGDLDED